VGIPSVVPPAQFLRQFSAFTKNIFEEFDFSNAVIVGDCLCASLLPLPPDTPDMEEYYSSRKYPIYLPKRVSEGGERVNENTFYIPY
jgi:hypothetical protein